MKQKILWKYFCESSGSEVVLVFTGKTKWAQVGGGCRLQPHLRGSPNECQ